MFDQLFTRAHARARHRAGPLLEERIRYLAYLAELGMRRINLQIRAHYVLVIAELLRLADRSGKSISAEEISQKALLWAQQAEPRKIPGSRRSRILFVRFAIAWLRFMARLQQVPATPVPFAEEIAAYAEYLRTERGLSPTTIESRCLTLRRFLSILNPANGSLLEITAAQIDEPCQRKLLRVATAASRYMAAQASCGPFFSTQRGEAGAAPGCRRQSKDPESTDKKRFPPVRPGAT
jgi:integrase/recombinase XerD